MKSEIWVMEKVFLMR